MDVAGRSHFSSVPGPIGSLGGHEGRFSRDSRPVFYARSPCEQFWHGQGCPCFDAAHPAFSLPTTASPTLQGALKDGFGEAVVACYMLEPCKLLTVARRPGHFSNCNFATGFAAFKKEKGEKKRHF